MNKKLLFWYLFLGIPFFVGVILYCLGIFNIFSSLLFFCGGYVVLKNVTDYRKIKKINNKVIMNEDNKKNNSRCINSENIVGFKRNIRYSKVRRKY